jgi:serine/threonine protein kinase
MAWVAVSCPQCGTPLPRVALWRSVKCSSCGSLITKTDSVVTRDSFHQALKRARQGSAVLDALLCGGHRYHLMQMLGVGEISQVHLARRIDSLPILATIKLSSAPAAAALYSREAQVLRELQALDADGVGAYFSRLIPEVISQGVVEGNDGRQALVLRHPSGFWGSLAALNERFAPGLDPRHAVWIWRRILEVLNFVHSHGWSHGNLRPEHALVHPQDHGVRLIGWSSAKKGAGENAKAADLCRSARVVQILLCGASGSGNLPGSVPTGLAQLVTRTAMAEDFCRSQGAEGLDALLRAEAKAAFGPPSFVPLTI